MIDERKISEVWENARTVDGVDSSLYRKDPCGAWIARNKYGIRDSKLGWEVDHVIPKALLESLRFSEEEIDDPINLRAMHWQNNASKGDDYPSYISVISAKDLDNVYHEESRKINPTLRADLNNFYHINL
jgi:hypothetical protein